MIVTPGTLQGVGQEGLSYRIRNVIQPLLPGDPEHAHPSLLPRAHPEESGRYQVLRIFLIDLIPRNLLPDKLVVGLV